MIAMMGALDGVAPPIAMQQLPANQMPAYVPMEPPSANQTPAYAYEEIPQEQGGRRSLKGKNSIRNVLGELRNLQDEEKKQTKKRSRSSPGKENMVDSPLRISELRPQQNIEVYRVDAPDAAGNLYPHFLRIQAERESDGVRFPPIPRNVWGSQFNFVPSQDIPDMPLLQVDRTVPGHKFPVSQRSQSLPRYIPEPGFFHPAPPPPQSNLPRQPSFPLFGTTASSDSGIGMPLLRFQNEEERQGRAPRFGELLPPEQVIESVGEAEKKLQLRERYLREYHQLQVKHNFYLDLGKMGLSACV
ncbi:hypothetical protein DPMN_157258 [Dreissena polymorpha]|uniref:Uncharacterized protein n=1 Tax=Dreissena polymorpha TaxID=45954 RepID=A0A9D4EH05_DREPO|nr:hypothetical protein DPMN_157258 [Dreissena polymorpha]